jgi:uncharacterized protein
MLKEVDFIHPHYRAFIEMSSYLIISSAGPGGLDASPRGDRAGFVVVEDDRKLLVPDRRGNNRVDTLHNLIADPRIGLLFLVPGIDESLRVNGTALISTDPKLLSRFEIDKKLPSSVTIVQVETAYFQLQFAQTFGIRENSFLGRPGQAMAQYWPISVARERIGNGTPRATP